MHRLTADDCAAVRGLLPYTAHALIAAIGEQATCTLINERPGVSLVIPRHANANAAGARRWAELAELIGEEAMILLSSKYGGEVLSIPVCKAARNELQARGIRALFDRLTMVDGYSGRQARYECCLRFAPITSRALELICNRGDQTGIPRQQPLFFGEER